MGDGGRVPGELEPGSRVGLHLQEVGRRGGAGNLAAAPGPRRGVHPQQGGGQGGSLLVARDHKDPVDLPRLQIVQDSARYRRVYLLQNMENPVKYQKQT
jgi:hypothetical protein